MKNHLWGRRPRFLSWTLILASVLLTLILAACTPAEETAQREGPRDECGYIEPSPADVEKTLSFGKSAFASEDWVKTYTVEPYKISLSRNNDVEGAVAYTEYLIYTCGYGQEEMNNYFNDEGFNIIFEGYESHTIAQFCEIKTLSLYKFDLIDEGLGYTANYWVKQEDDNHILVMMLVFPQESTALLDEYSQKIFPELTVCP
jgi:hypothetical protein